MKFILVLSNLTYSFLNSQIAVALATLGSILGLLSFFWNLLKKFKKPYKNRENHTNEENATNSENSTNSIKILFGIFFVLLLSLIVLLGIGYYYTPSGTVRVPNFINLKPTTALEKVAEHSLILDNEFFPTDNDHIVIGQSIPQNTIVNIGTHISLTFQVCESDENLDTDESIDEESNYDDENTLDLTVLPDIYTGESIDYEFYGKDESTSDLADLPDIYPDESTDLTLQTIEDNDNFDSENIRIEVPNFIGLTKAEMESLRYSISLNIKYNLEYDDSNITDDRYKVIYQSIEPNELVPINTTIEVDFLSIYSIDDSNDSTTFESEDFQENNYWFETSEDSIENTSTFPEESNNLVYIPDFLKYSEKKMNDLIALFNLDSQLKIERLYDDGGPYDCCEYFVSYQSMVGGCEVFSNSHLQITLSPIPYTEKIETIIIPNLLGLYEEDMITLLNNYDLYNKLQLQFKEYNIQVGYYCDYYYVSDQSIPCGEEVDIYISLYHFITAFMST